MTDTSPTVRQWELGKRLRELRKQHGLTIEDVAYELMCSATKISRLETGKRPTSLRDLCVHYGVNKATRAKLRVLPGDSGVRLVDSVWGPMLDSFSASGRMLKLSGASPWTSYRHYCKPKTMRETSQAVSTTDRD